MMDNCSNDYPSTDVLYEELSGDTTLFVFLVVSCLLTATCVGVYIEEIIFLLRSYHDNSSRRTTLVVLLGLFPVASVLALISLVVPTSTVLTDLLASCYLSVCIYTFVHMTIGFYGGDEAMIRAFRDEKILVTTPPCCCLLRCVVQPIALTKKSLARLKLCSLQVIVVRPLLMFTGAVLWTDGRYEQKFSITSDYTYIALLSGVSTLFSVYGMVVIFKASRQKLQHHSLTLKFIPVQLSIILINLQHTVFNAMAQRGIPECVGSRGSHVRNSALCHSVLVIEMMLISLLARKAYRRVELEDDSASVRVTITGIQKDAVNGVDNADFSESYGTLNAL